MLPGHIVQCCFAGTFDWTVYNSPELQSGCQVQSMCADPDVWDTDGDGDLSALELQPFCQQKCDLPWPGGDAVIPGWTPPGAHGDVLWSCNAYTGPPSSVLHLNSCNPPDDYEGYGERIEVPPTHETTFTTGSGSGSKSKSKVSMTVLGNVVDPDAVLDVEFALDQCDNAGYDGGTCRIVLQRFDLATTSEFAAGAYDILGVELELSAAVVAQVDFSACSGGSCTGSFSFERANDNELTMALLWTQRNRRLGNVDDGALPIGNDSSSLGGIDALQGIIEIDPATGAGELVLTGGGSDRLSGEFAAVSFSLRGAMVPR